MTKRWSIETEEEVSIQGGRKERDIRIYHKPLFEFPYLERVKDKINILILTAWFVIGGTEKANYDLLRRIDRSKFNLYIITTVHHPYKDSHVNKFMEVNPYCYELFTFLLEPQHYLEFILNFIKTRHIDILLVAGSLYGYEHLKDIKENFPQIKIIDYLHAYDSNWLDGGYPAYSAKHCDNFIEKHIVISKNLKNILLNQFSVRADKIVLNYINVDCDETFNPLLYKNGIVRREIGLSDHVSVIAFIGRLCNEKRPLKFIEIAEKIVKQNPTLNIHFLVIGDGDLYNKTKEAITTKKLSNSISMLGNRFDIPLILKDTTLLVLPSESEGLALTTYEAMSMGVPVISADVGGQSELIDHGINGFLVKKDQYEVEQYAKLIIDLISQDDRFNDMRRKAREKILAYHNIKHTIQTFGKVFTELTSIQSNNHV